MSIEKRLGIKAGKMGSAEDAEPIASGVDETLSRPIMQAVSSTELVSLVDELTQQVDEAAEVVDMADLEYKAERFFLRGYESERLLGAAMGVDALTARTLLVKVRANLARGVSEEDKAIQHVLAYRRQTEVLRQAFLLYHNSTKEPWVQLQCLNLIAKCTVEIGKLMGVYRGEEKVKFYLTLVNNFVSDLRTLVNGVNDPMLAAQLALILDKYGKQTATIEIAAPNVT